MAGAERRGSGGPCRWDRGRERTRRPRRGRAPAAWRSAGPGLSRLQARSGPKRRVADAGADSGSGPAALPPLPPQPPHRDPRALPLPLPHFRSTPPPPRPLYPAAPPPLWYGEGHQPPPSPGAVHAGTRSARPPAGALPGPAGGGRADSASQRRAGAGLLAPDWLALAGARGGARARGSGCPVATEGESAEQPVRCGPRRRGGGRGGQERAGLGRAALGRAPLPPPRGAGRGGRLAGSWGGAGRAGPHRIGAA